MHNKDTKNGEKLNVKRCTTTRYVYFYYSLYLYSAGLKLKSV